MTKLDKAKERIRNIPRDYSYSEAKFLLGRLGFREINKGKTSGSRVKFLRDSDGEIILMHRLHLTDIMVIQAVRDLAYKLRELGDI